MDNAQSLHQLRMALATNCPWLRLRRLLQVHKSGDYGSPRVVDSTSECRSSMLACVWLIGLRPPPSCARAARQRLRGRATRSELVRSCCARVPWRAIKECPAVSASAAPNRRLPRSLSTGPSASNRWRMADSSIIQPCYSSQIHKESQPAN